ncbi:MAG: oxygen-independent coproporphyrinogen III oxidase [Bacteroidota bacterium]
MDRFLLEKYDVPAPRYTSYPTVPYWQKTPPTQAAWLEQVQLSFDKNDEISLYIHLPFCEKLCTYCACNKKITKRHKVELPYIEALLQEWKIYTDALPSRPKLKTLHIGGGTPTFFSPENLKKLFGGIFAFADVAPNHEFSFEAHPNNTTREHLKVLHQLGFNRVSVGVQDVDEEILSLINRHQTLEAVERVTQQARAIGYRSVNFDLIFGLPKQTKRHIVKTIKAVKRLYPDRIAFYSYAHVPWKSKWQQAYDQKDLPMGMQKRALYELGKRLLEQIGYSGIGMDHFALKSDELWAASENGTLHRNFMGYTNRHTDLMIGLGASAISDSWTAFAQNEKKVKFYQGCVADGALPIIKGHLLNREDQVLRQHILNLSCRFESCWEDPALYHPSLMDAQIRWKPMEADGLIECSYKGIKVLPIGRAFIRNICMAMDARLWQGKMEKQLFSQSV